MFTFDAHYVYIYSFLFLFWVSIA